MIRVWNGWKGNTKKFGRVISSNHATLEGLEGLEGLKLSGIFILRFLRKEYIIYIQLVLFFFGGI